MKKSIDKNLLYSEPVKFIFRAIFIICILSFFWDIYKYFHNNVDISRLCKDVVAVGFSILFYKLIVKESPFLNSFIKSKVGLILFWVIIIGYVIYSLKFPINVILLIVILAFTALYLVKVRRYYKNNPTSTEAKR
ncbi:MAG: hypothetical protein GY775_03960 [Candidatus Scalindua sp.]|nr:hypothetical protein [Candidatus Scalindua sp.]